MSKFKHGKWHERLNPKNFLNRKRESMSVALRVRKSVCVCAAAWEFFLLRMALGRMCE